MKTLPIKEVAQVLGLSVDTINRYIRCGRIKGTAVAGNVRKRYVVLQSDLDDYLESNRVVVVTETPKQQSRPPRTPCPILSKYGY